MTKGAEGVNTVRCDQCGKFCGVGCKQYRRYDWQGVPIEDYVICAKCEDKK